MKGLSSYLRKPKSQSDLLARAQLGIDKKSFAMFFGGGEIWFEHLDGMYALKAQVIKKFLEDTPSIAKPSAPSLIAVNLDETDVDEEIIALITDTYIKNAQYIQKVVFVGLNRQAQGMMKRAFEKRRSEVGFTIAYIHDFEKAKEWLTGAGAPR